MTETRRVRRSLRISKTSPCALGRHHERRVATGGQRTSVTASGGSVTASRTVKVFFATRAVTLALFGVTTRTRRISSGTSPTIVRLGATREPEARFKEIRATPRWIALVIETQLAEAPPEAAAWCTRQIRERPGTAHTAAPPVPASRWASLQSALSTGSPITPVTLAGRPSGDDRNSANARRRPAGTSRINCGGDAVGRATAVLSPSPPRPQPAKLPAAAIASRPATMHRPANPRMAQTQIDGSQ